MIWAVLFFSPKNQVRAGRIVGSMLAILSFDDLDSQKKTANTWGELVKIDMERTKCLGKEQNLHDL